MEPCIQKEEILDIKKNLRINDEKTLTVWINLDNMKKELHSVFEITKDTNKTMNNFIKATNERFEKERAKSNLKYAPMISHTVWVGIAKLIWWAIILAIITALFKLLSTYG